MSENKNENEYKKKHTKQQQRPIDWTKHIYYMDLWVCGWMHWFGWKEILNLKINHNQGGQRTGTHTHINWSQNNIRWPLCYVRQWVFEFKTEISPTKWNRKQQQQQQSQEEGSNYESKPRPKLSCFSFVVVVFRWFVVYLYFTLYNCNCTLSLLLVVVVRSFVYRLFFFSLYILSFVVVSYLFLPVKNLCISSFVMIFVLGDLQVAMCGGFLLLLYFADAMQHITHLIRIQKIHRNPWDKAFA